MKNGAFIIDPAVTQEVPGVAMQRGNGWVFFILQGYHRFGTGNESLIAHIRFNEEITGAINGPRRPLEKYGDGIYEYKYGGQDEMFPNIGTQTARWVTSVTTGADSFYIWYDFDDVNLGGLPVPGWQGQRWRWKN